VRPLRGVSGLGGVVGLFSPLSSLGPSWSRNWLETWYRLQKRWTDRTGKDRREEVSERARRWDSRPRKFQISSKIGQHTVFGKFSGVVLHFCFLLVLLCVYSFLSFFLSSDARFAQDSNGLGLGLGLEEDRVLRCYDVCIIAFVCLRKIGDPGTWEERENWGEKAEGDCGARSERR